LVGCGQGEEKMKTGQGRRRTRVQSRLTVAIQRNTNRRLSTSLLLL
jgi:hypothetical protein